jgi:S-DNA-T family DNA segregation ATPase FtsK/SpoIIIE
MTTAADNVVDLDSRRRIADQDVDDEQLAAVSAGPDDTAAAAADEQDQPAGRLIRVVRHRHTQTAVRQVVYVAAGAMTTAKNRRDDRSTARHQRMMRAAEAAGNHEAALEWEQRAAHHRAEKHRRRMELLKRGPRDVLRALITAGVAIAGTLLVLGILLAANSRQVADVIRPFRDAAAFASLVANIVAAIWAPVLAMVPLGLIVRLWDLGRRRVELPAWLMPEKTSKPDSVIITPSVVVMAFRELGIADLRKHIKEMADGAAAMLGPVRLAGCGVEVEVTLPLSVDTGQIMARRRKLAENLGRHEHELYISKAPAARTVRLWIADSGALDEPIAPSPLVLDATARADFISGRAPWGVDLRGDLVAMFLYQCHLLITGLSNQGKTAALRALALWAALDPCVEFRLADLKGVGDWSMFDGLATELIEGPTDAHVIAATEMVEELAEEIERRIGRLNASGSAEGITVEMARKPGSGFHPLIGIVDEAQVAFMCPVKDDQGRPYGGAKSTSRYFMAVRKIQNQGRAVNVTIWEGTQNPTDQNLPVLVREGAHNRIALVLGTEAQAKMALGETPVNKGAAPHELRQGLDKGVVVAVGEGVPVPTGQPAVTIRTHFIDGKEATALADRAKALRKPVTTRARSAEEQTEKRDLLLDVASILGFDETLVKSSEVNRRLAEIGPDAYRGWTQNKLSAELAPFAVIPRKTIDGTMHVDHDEVRAAIAAREASGD